ncbi:MAG: branched-chain amino acid ABC transporter permease [Eubacteriales bacterium]|jgi:branched-chain amino acid transport system permease protein
MKKIMKNRTIIKALVLLICFVVVQLLDFAGFIDGYIMGILARICINIILAVSLNLITGFTGQFSLGHAGFMSIGAYACAITTFRFPTIPGFIAGVFLGAICAAIVGALVGLPTLRLRGDYLAIATLGMAEIIRIMFLNMDITNGAAGLIGIPQFVNWPWLFIFTVGTVVLIRNFIKSAHGRACISIREDEIASESMGTNTTGTKVMAFTIGAFFAGIAGALYASYFFFIKPELFGFQKSIDVLVIVVFGGLGSISGSVVAAVLLEVISTMLQSIVELRMVFYATLLVIIMLFRPQGLMGSKEITALMFKDQAGKLWNRIRSARGKGGQA